VRDDEKEEEAEARFENERQEVMVMEQQVEDLMAQQVQRNNKQIETKAAETPTQAELN